MFTLCLIRASGKDISVAFNPDGTDQRELIAAATRLLADKITEEIE